MQAIYCTYRIFAPTLFWWIFVAEDLGLLVGAYLFAAIGLAAVGAIVVFRLCARGSTCESSGDDGREEGDEGAGGELHVRWSRRV